MRSRTLITLAIVAAPVAVHAEGIAGLCAQPELPERPDRPPVLEADALVGTYRCSDEGLTITLRLDANGRFLKQIETDERIFEQEPLFENEAGEKTRQFSRSGQWRVGYGTLHLFERPTQAPQIKLVEAKRDPSIWMRVEIREPDGKPARGLFVGEGEDANPRSSPHNGIIVVPRSYAWDPGVRHIVREGDNLRLTSFTVTRDGPNSFGFIYQPSEVEPFDETVDIADARGDAVIVSLGMVGAVLRRVEARK